MVSLSRARISNNTRPGAQFPIIWFHRRVVLHFSSIIKPGRFIDNTVGSEMGLTHVSELGSNRKLVFVGVCRREHCEIAWDGGTEVKADCCPTVADVAEVPA